MPERTIAVGLIATIGNAIWAKLSPLIETQLTGIRADAKAELAELRKDVMAEVAAIREALPEIAGAVAEQAIKTTFEHTQVDEAADAVSGVITDIANRVRFPFISH